MAASAGGVNQVVEPHEYSLYAAERTAARNIVRFPQVDDHAASSAGVPPSYVVRDTRNPDAVVEAGRSSLQGCEASPAELGAVVRNLIAKARPQPVPVAGLSKQQQRRQLPETADKHGITWPEIKRISDGYHHMRTVARDHGLRVYRVDCAKGADTKYFEQRLVTIQAKEGVARLWLRVDETKPACHSHYLILVNDQVLARLTSSRKFKATTAGGGLVFHFAEAKANIRDVVSYLAKEATSTAWFRNHLVKSRKRGSHRLPGNDIADRVTVSAELAKHVDPWKRTYRRHKAANDYPAERRRPSLPERKAPRFTDQVVLPFTEPQVRRPVARLRDFGGGLVPPVVADEIEFRRHRLGWSQRELARQCGIRQPQLANALRGHDPLSAWVTNRLHEILLDRAAA